MKKRFFITILSAVLSISLLATPVLAASEEAGTKAVASQELTVTNGDAALTAQAEAALSQTEQKTIDNRILFNYLRLITPAMGKKISKGTKISFKFNIKDTWKYYYTRPVVAIYNSKGKCVYSGLASRVPATGYTYTYSGKVNYKSGYLNYGKYKLAKGKYKFVVYAAPCYKSGTLLSNWASWNLVYDYNYFYIK